MWRVSSSNSQIALLVVWKVYWNEKRKVVLPQRRLKELREQKHLSQTDLAKQVGLSPQAISAFESNDRNPKMSNWIKLADYFGV